MPFVHADQLPKMELFPGVRGSLATGKNLMLSFLEMEIGYEIPEHSHPHEQAGMVLEGQIRFRIGREERVVGPGEAFIVPPNVVHWGQVEEGPVRILDIFSPPREDYQEQYNRFNEISEKTVWE